MYTSYFGLNENPFSIAPDPLYLYMSEHHREAFAHLTYGVKTDGGFVLLTGEVGAGKTTLCRSLLEQLPENVVIAYVLNPKVSVIELLETICDELHIDRPEQGSIKQLVDCLNAYLLEANAQGRKTVLIIDEAQNLSIDVLEQLRLLTNLETNRYKLLQIVLLGQPELLQILNRQEMRQLSQRITARCHLGSLDANEIGAYIRHRLNIAGCKRPLFPETLDKTIGQLTGGIPRLINLVCDRALLGAYALERQEVDNTILQQAAREVLGEQGCKNTGTNVSMTVSLVCIVLLLFAAVFWSWKTSFFATASAPSAAITPASENKSSSTEPATATKPEPVINPAAAPLAKDPAQALSAIKTEAIPQPSSEPGEALEKTLPLTWPMDFATAQTREMAFTDLAELWGISYPANRRDYCTFAMDYDLGCMARKDSLETLRNMDRPAILTLYADDGAPFHVVMANLADDKATFIAGDREYEMALAAITSRWFGEYLLLWKRPPFQSKLLQPGAKGDSVDWLAETLQELGGYEATGQEVRLEGTLLGAFKRFQFSNGLTPDGILGPMSLIHLNSARKVPGPRLSMQGES
jgi:general secretion pathway protein A